MVDRRSIRSYAVVLALGGVLGGGAVWLVMTEGESSREPLAALDAPTDGGGEAEPTPPARSPARPTRNPRPGAPPAPPAAPQREQKVGDRLDGGTLKVSIPPSRDGDGPNAAGAPSPEASPTPPPSDPQPLVVQGSGSSFVSGTVVLVGDPPSLPPVARNRDTKACGTEAPDPSLQLDGNAVANAVISLEGPTTQLWMASSHIGATLDQRGCTFVPHVSVLPPGAWLTAVNSDSVLHNLHAYLGESTLINVAMPIKNQQIKRTLSVPGVVHFKCDVHPWMSAWIVVTPQLSAVSQPDGTFRIDGVNPGTYQLTVWHERLHGQPQQIVVPPGGGGLSGINIPLQ